MFENVTGVMSKGAYTGETALLEIVILLLVAFIFGWVARMIWENVFGGEDYDYHYFDYEEFDELEEADETEKQNQEEIVSPTGYKFDDLKIVEGIGPKIEELLKEAGIKNWKDLADASVESLKGILKSAGEKFSFHDPSTWPEQAKLAYEQKWDELDEFQEFLIGGKKLS